MWRVEDDGVTHINIYSRGATQVGRDWSNLAHSPFVHPVYGAFASIEGLWYWLSVRPENRGRESLRTLWGPEAKRMGRRLRGRDWPKEDGFEFTIRQALWCKARYNLPMFAALQQTSLPLVHYYVHDGIIQPVPNCGWLIFELAEIQWSGRR